MHLPKYTARVSVIVASFVFVSSVVYKQVTKMHGDITFREMTGADSSEIDPIPKILRDSLCTDFYKTVCVTNSVVSDPTGSVEPDIKGEVEALRMYEKILHQHPDWSNERVDEELVNRIYTPRRKKMLFEIYDWIQKQMVKLIEKQPEDIIPSPAKDELIRRLRLIVLELPPPASVYGNEPDLFTKNDVYYESFPGDKKVIRVGGAYLLSAKSWFNRVFTIAHEMSHAIDPCELEAMHFEIEGYRRLLQCFQSEKNTGPNRVKDGCAKNNYLGELFSDWLASQVTVRALEFYSSKLKDEDELSKAVMNSVKDLCSEESWMDQNIESHPESRVRVEKIFGRNPALRGLLRCGQGVRRTPYCTFEGKK